ncbi:MAG: GNAT family N-acetyltransferase [Erysipelotrichaceae bacterium]|nr:GNAT family N-acetyltransferase [Erysipelotrichaceae bacterium]
MYIRKATREDIPEIIRIRKLQLIDEGLSPDIEIDADCHRYFHDMFNQERIIELFVEDDDRVIATAAIILYDFPPSFSNQTGRKGYVTNMYTDPDYRRQGIATKLLEMLDEEAKERGIERLWLGASKWGRSVYEKSGYIATNEWLDKKL